MQWAAKLNEHHLQDNTKPIAFYVALRQVTSEGLDGYFGSPTAKGGFDFDINPFFSAEPPAPAVWLFDGLDELSPNLKPHWLELIRRRSEDVCVVSCRTAVYGGEFGGPTEIMGLNPTAQLAFLRERVRRWQEQRYPLAFVVADDAWVQRLHAAIQRSTQLAPLAGSPLLLTLLALAHPPTSDLNLATSRPSFYRKAFDELVKARAHPPLNRGSRLPGKLRQLLMDLVSEVERQADFPAQVLDDLIARHQALSEKEVETLYQSEIVRLKGPLEDKCEFLHLTFQEWLLAELLARPERGGLVQAVETFWKQPQYEETLSLLWGMATPDERHTATLRLVNYGCQEVTLSGKKVYRSGLRTALHLWARSGVMLDGTQALPLLLGYVQQTHLRMISIASDPNTPAEVLLALVRSDNLNVRSTAVQNPNIPAEALLPPVQGDDQVVRARAVRSPITLAEVLSILAQSDDASLLFNVARNPSTPVEVLLKLAQDDASYYGVEVARNPNAPAGAFWALAQSDNVYARGVAAENSKTPVEVLLVLAQDDFRDVRQGVARNPKTPAAALLALAQDDDPQVRYSVARNPSIPAGALMALVQEDDWGMRLGVARNPSAPAETLMALAQDDDLYVRQIVAGNPGTPSEVLSLLAHDHVGVRRELALNPSAPAEVLSALARDHRDARRGVAGNPNAPVEALLTLARDDAFDVHRELALNPNAPAEALLVLAHDHDYVVRNRTAGNPNAPAEALLTLAQGEDERVRSTVSYHSGACPEWF